MRERLRRRQARLGLGAPAHLLGGLLQGGHEEVVLAREVVVEQRLRDPGLARDPRHRQLAERVAREQLGAELEQPAPALVDLEAGVGGLAHGGRSPNYPVDRWSRKAILGCRPAVNTGRRSERDSHGARPATRAARAPDGRAGAAGRPSRPERPRAVAPPERRHRRRPRWWCRRRGPPRNPDPRDAGGARAARAARLRARGFELPDRDGLEDLLGGRVLAWVGGLAVLLGLVFLLALDASRWLDRRGRAGRPGPRWHPGARA